MIRHNTATIVGNLSGALTPLLGQQLTSPADVASEG
jgi:hypothetical protein